MPEQNKDPNAAPASSVRVYDQPERRGNPLMKIIPIILVLSVLGYLLSRAMRPSEPEPVSQPSAQEPSRMTPSAQDTPAGTRGSGDARSTTNPPGPAGRDGVR